MGKPIILDHTRFEVHPRARETEKDHCVVIFLCETVVCHEGARKSIDVGPRVLHLARGLEHGRDGFVAHVGKLEQRVVWQMLHGKLTLNHVAWVRDAQHTMAKAWNDLAAGEGVLRKLSQHFHCGLRASKRLLCALQPAETLLIRKAVQWRSKTTITSCVGQVGIRQGASNEVSRVR